MLFSKYQFCFEETTKATTPQPSTDVNTGNDQKYCKTNSSIAFTTQYFADKIIFEVLFNEMNGLALKQSTLKNPLIFRRHLLACESGSGERPISRIPRIKLCCFCLQGEMAWKGRVSHLTLHLSTICKTRFLSA